MGRKLRFGAQSALLTVIVIAAVVIVNAVFSLLAQKAPMEVDLTGSREFSVSEQSRAYFDTVDTPVDVYLVTETGFEDTDAVREIVNYCRAFPILTLHRVTPKKDPAFIKEHEVVLSGNAPLSVVVSCRESGRSRTVAYNELFTGTYRTKEDFTMVKQMLSNTEGILTAAVEYVLSDETPTVYYTVGHDEQITEGDTRLDVFTRRLRAENMDVLPLTLLEPVPEDADIVIIGGAQSDFGIEELNFLDMYMEQGGRLQVYSAPYVTLPNLNSYLQEQWGITIEYDSVAEGQKDRLFSFTSGDWYFLATLGEQDMLKNFKESDNICWPYSTFANTITVEENDYIEVVPVLTTTQQGTAYLYEDMKAYSAGTIDKLEPSRETGTQNLMVYGRKNPLHNEETTARILVAGNAELLYMLRDENTFANQKLLIASIDYMTDFKGLKAKIPNKNITGAVFDISTAKILGAPAKTVYNVVFIGFLPLLMLGMAIYVAVKRRYM